MNKQFLLLLIAFFSISALAIELTPEQISNPRNITEAIISQKILITSPVLQKEYNEEVKFFYDKLMKTPEGQSYQRIAHENSVNSKEELTISIDALFQTEIFKKEYWPVRQEQLKLGLRKAALEKMARYVNNDVGVTPRDSMHQAINSALFIDNHPCNKYEDELFEKLETEPYDFADSIDQYYANKVN